MKHILDCEESELQNFVINKSYNGHKIRVKPITDFSRSDKIERRLHVLFEMFNGFEINLGEVHQEMVFDDYYFNHFVEKRLKHIASYLVDLTNHP